MKFFFCFLTLAFLVNTINANFEQDVAMDAVPSSLTGSNLRPEMSAHGRRLAAAWSWSNLLFHIGVCKAKSNCPSKPHPGPCGCPDCSKPHPPHFQNGYCDNSSSTSYSTNGGDSSSSYYDSNGESYTEDRTNGAGQTGTSTFKAWMVFLAVATAFIAGFAYMMRKRPTAIATKDLDGTDESANRSNGGNYMMMGGVGLALAGLMTRLGLKRDSSDDSTSSGSSGMVSKRMGLMAGEGGAAAPPLSRKNTTAPSFITIPAEGSVMPETHEDGGGIEVDGPYRPSSVYAI